MFKSKNVSNHVVVYRKKGSLMHRFKEIFGVIGKIALISLATYLSIKISQFLVVPIMVIAALLAIKDVIRKSR